MKFQRITKLSLSCILSVLLLSCTFNPDEEISAIRQNQFQLKINKIKNNFFLVWPHQINTLPDSENLKLQSLIKILSQANDVEIEITPIYKSDLYNNAKILNREFLVRDILCGFGIPLNKIFIKRQIEPQRYEEGFVIKVISYQLKIPNCESFKDNGAKSTEESMKSFGCSTVANFGKLIAYPSSLNKYKKTSNDRSTAIKAINQIDQNGGGD